MVKPQKPHTPTKTTEATKATKPGWKTTKNIKQNIFQACTIAIKKWLHTDTFSSK